MSNGSNIPDAAISAASAKRGAGDADSNPMITRAASYTQLADEPDLKASPQRRGSLNRSFSENVLANMQGKVARQHSTEQSSEPRLKAKRSLRRLKSFRRQSTQVESTPHFTIPEFAVGPDESTEDITNKSKPRRNGLTNDRERKTRSVLWVNIEFCSKAVDIDLTFTVPITKQEALSPRGRCGHRYRKQLFRRSADTSCYLQWLWKWPSQSTL